jgi:hypothetical protein
MQGGNEENKNLSQRNWCPAQDLNHAPLEYQSQALLLGEITHNEE